MHSVLQSCLDMMFRDARAPLSLCVSLGVTCWNARFCSTEAGKLMAKHTRHGMMTNIQHKDRRHHSNYNLSVDT